jgi:hypothetical protein
MEKQSLLELRRISGVMAQSDKQQLAPERAQYSTHSAVHAAELQSRANTTTAPAAVLHCVRKNIRTLQQSWKISIEKAIY